MATDERESNTDRANEERTEEFDVTKKEIKTEDTKEQKDEVKSTTEVVDTSAMLVTGYLLPPEKRAYSLGGPLQQGPKNIAETYVTRSSLDRYGPIVSPTVSPTKTYEAVNSSTKRPSISSYSKVECKTEQDYEAATLICSMRDSITPPDTMRMSWMSTFLKPDLSISKEHQNSFVKREPYNHGSRVVQQQAAAPDSDKQTGQDRCSFIKHEENAKESSNSSTHHSDDTDHSDGENEDYSMIVRPREPGHDAGEASVYGCRLPCCSRPGYRTHSPENATYSPIRVPARRPGQYPSPPHVEHGSTFGRHRDIGKSAFTAVSPGQKRHETEYAPASMPSVKVRVIQERNSDSDNIVNGFRDSSPVSKVFSEKVMFPEAVQKISGKKEALSNGKLPNGGNFHDKTASPKSDDFAYIRSALINNVIGTKSTDENHAPENKYSSDDFIIPRPAASFINGVGSSYSSTFTPPNSNGYVSVKRENATNGYTTSAVQCSKVDSTGTEADGESRLLDLARVANEHLGEELAKQQPVFKRVKQKSNDCLHLWEFLRDILNNDSMSPKAIEWTVRERGEFRLIKTGVVAQLWGLSKNRTSMTYEKMARAMRYYYKMKILEKVPHKRLHFRFGKHMLPKVL
ncbi:uncharacterized protein LOC135694702 isoform X1 [Rhopilema esculentum]|uniref:uncharacterized protein LOC135694702 isoform X1 n=1 Tax=Rhopilema esculentum TaxID=499914 RepID=UPI0031DB5C34